jgi:hypothetical protein
MNHKSKIISDIETRLSRIVLGEITQDDVELMLVHLRHYTQGSMFEELAHFIAHPERDQGKFFDHVKPMVQEMVNAFKTGGKFDLIAILTYSKVMDELVATLDKLDINFDETRLRIHTNKIVHVIMDVIHLTMIKTEKLNSPEVKSAVFEKSNTGEGIEDYYLWLVLSFEDKHHGVIKTFANVRICIPIISPN